MTYRNGDNGEGGARWWATSTGNSMRHLCSEVSRDVAISISLHGCKREDVCVNLATDRSIRIKTYEEGSNICQRLCPLDCLGKQ